MKRVLLVDDHEDTLLVLRSLFSDAYDVVMCKNGRAAVDLLSKSHFDLVLTDIVMPEIEGIELILYSKKTFPNMKIIAVTGQMNVGGQDYLEAATAFGVDACFRKPFSLVDLLAKVNNLLKE